MTLSQPMMVVSRATGGLPGGMLEDLTGVAGGRVDFCPLAEVAGLDPLCDVAGPFCDAESITVGVDEAAEAARESTFDLGAG